MERISDKNIELELEGTFTSAVVDKAGDRLAEDAIRGMKAQIENNPNKRKFTVDHSRRVIGEILDVWINENEEGILELNGRVGVYEGNDRVIERMESGDLNAFSIEASYFENTDREEWSNANQVLRLEVDGNQRGEIHSDLSSHQLGFKADIEKSATGIAVFGIIVENIHKIALAIVILHQYFSTDESEGDNRKNPEKIELPNEDEIDINQDIEGVLKDVEQKLGEEIDIDYESLSTEEIKEELQNL